jgi:hypothetical protein
MISECFQESNQSSLLFFSKLRVYRSSTNDKVFCQSIIQERVGLNVAIVVIDDFLKRVETPVMHVRCGDFDVPQRNNFEPAII